MSTPLKFRKIADFSPVIAEQKVIGVSVTSAGDAVWLTVAPQDESTALGVDTSSGLATFPESRSRRGYAATFIRTSGREVVQQTELSHVEVAHPHVQALPNGEVLIVGSRCKYQEGSPERNATIFTVAGEMRARFVLGDGIQDVRTTKEGLIWVSYFDEGVFGNYGWEEPLGFSGLNCFDATGRLKWRFSPPTGFDSMCDCYALNVSEGTVWAYYYTDFPAVKIDAQNQVTGWKNDHSGAKGIAANDEGVLLWGGYGEQKHSLVAQRFGSDGLIRERKFIATLPNGRDLRGTVVVGCGSRLYAFAGSEWFELDVTDTLS